MHPLLLSHLSVPEGQESPVLPEGLSDPSDRPDPGNPARPEFPEDLLDPSDRSGRLDR